MRHSLTFLLVLALSAPPLAAQNATELLGRMTVNDQSKIVSYPPAWLRSRTSDLDVCRGSFDALTPKAAAAWRASIEERLTKTNVRGLQRTLAEFDTDQDGQITGAEAQTDAEKLNNYRTILDSNKDGEIGADEIERNARERARREDQLLGGCDELFVFDLDQDGAVTLPDLTGISDIVSAEIHFPRSAQTPCALPEYEYNHRVRFVVFGVRQGTPRAEDNVPEVELRSSGTHILLLSEQPTVWRYTGDPQKVVAVLIVEGAGEVLGLPPEKIVRLAQSECTRFQIVEPASPEGYILRGQIGHAIGFDVASIQMEMQETAELMPSRR